MASSYQRLQNESRRTQVMYFAIAVEVKNLLRDPSGWIEDLHPQAVDHARPNRDRGKSRDSSPPTPPDVRVRIRRFGGLSRPRHRDGSQAKGPQGASG